MNLGADPIALAAARKAAGLSGPHGEAPTIRAPCCGRLTDPDSVLDIRMVPGIGHDFLCDACRHRLVADKHNAWTHSKLARAAGLGWPEIREHRIRELLAEEVRTTGRIDRSKAHATISNDLPARNIPGTEAPPGIAWVRR